jgi:hypothetical protein
VRGIGFRPRCVTRAITACFRSCRRHLHFADSIGATRLAQLRFGWRLRFQHIGVHESHNLSARDEIAFIYQYVPYPAAILAETSISTASMRPLPLAKASPFDGMR